MQKHTKRGQRSSKRRRGQLKKLNNFDKLLNTFNQLEEPVQIVLILGLLLLLAWMIAHPTILVGIINLLLGWKFIQGNISGY